jgi:hypothetical protein
LRKLCTVSAGDIEGGVFGFGTAGTGSHGDGVMRKESVEVAGTIVLTAAVLGLCDNNCTGAVPEYAPPDKKAPCNEVGTTVLPGTLCSVEEAAGASVEDVLLFARVRDLVSSLDRSAALFDPTLVPW